MTLIIMFAFCLFKIKFFFFQSLIACIPFTLNFLISNFKKGTSITRKEVFMSFHDLMRIDHGEFKKHRIKVKSMFIPGCLTVHAIYS